MRFRPVRDVLPHRAQEAGVAKWDLGYPLSRQLFRTATHRPRHPASVSRAARRALLHGTVRRSPALGSLRPHTVRCSAAAPPERDRGASDETPRHTHGCGHRLLTRLTDPTARWAAPGRRA